MGVGEILPRLQIPGPYITITFIGFTMGQHCSKHMTNINPLNLHNPISSSSVVILVLQMKQFRHGSVTYSGSQNSERQSWCWNPESSSTVCALHHNTLLQKRLRDSKYKKKDKLKENA